MEETHAAHQPTDASTWLHRILHEVWSYESFRPQQEEIITQAYYGNDVLALLPTGGGKSLLYQVAGLAREGVTLVISPLIALMEDQVYDLQERGVIAYTIHSGLPFTKVRTALEHLAQAQHGFLYLSPERLHSSLFQQFLPKLAVRLIAVDEAHCISQWGFDFRPAYRQIITLREACPQVPLMAVTATATPEVAQDIAKQLGFQASYAYFQAPFIRDNLVYGVQRVNQADERLILFVKRMKGCGIVYTRSRRQTKILALKLQHHGVAAHYYHAGLDYSERMARQQAWMENKINVMVATNAFGMGVNKPDVRFVAHYGYPPSLEEYYQEIGRAGRDGQRSFVALYVDHHLNWEAKERFIRRYPKARTVSKAWHKLYRFLAELEATQEDEALSLPYTKGVELISGWVRNTDIPAVQIIALLVRQGYLELIKPDEENFTMRISTSQEHLAEVRNTYPYYNLLLQWVLGHYSGITREWTKINMQALQRATQLDTHDVLASLKGLTQLGVIQYEPPDTTFQLLLTAYGATQEHYDLTRYRAEREREAARLEAMLHYTHATEGCRESILRHYFGEENTPPCQHCDLCLTKQHPITLQAFARELAQLLATHPQGLTFTQTEDIFYTRYSSHIVNAHIKTLVRIGLLWETPQRIIQFHLPKKWKNDSIQ